MRPTRTVGRFSIKKGSKFSRQANHTHLQTKGFENCIQGFKGGVAFVVLDLNQGAHRDFAHAGKLGLLQSGHINPKALYRLTQSDFPLSQISLNAFDHELAGINGQSHFKPHSRKR